MSSAWKHWAIATLGAALIGLTPLAMAQTAPSAQTKAEIEGLFGALKASGCEFQRNGSWYAADKAADHLRQKYDYLLKKNLVPSTEVFIERAASQSSMSGKPYQVRCTGQAEVASKAWFGQQLKRMRSAAPRS